MKHFLKITIFFFGLCLVTGASSFAKEQERAGKQYKETFSVGSFEQYLKSKGEKRKVRPFNYLLISQINLKKPAYGVFVTSGYIVKEYKCPECPEGAMCKPCPADYIVISEGRTKFDFHTVEDKQMLIFTGNDQSFDVGSRYRLTVKILDVKTTGQPINNVQLIFAKKVKGD